MNLVVILSILAIAAAAAIKIALHEYKKKRKISPRSSAPSPNAPPITPSRRIAPLARIATPFAAKGQAAPLTWLGPGTSIEIGGFKLADPCVYASNGTKHPYEWATDPSEIMLQAEVKRPWQPVAELGYWPWYSRMSPEQRYGYIGWLASGKLALPPLEGYLFLYYYGLERRLLVDRQDREWTIREIVRLRRIDEPRKGSRDGDSFRRYTTRLLWFEIARSPERFDQKAIDLVCGLTETWNAEFVAVHLAWHAKHARPLPADLARRVAQQDPRSQQSIVLKRVGQQFNELFDERYREKFGAGFVLKSFSLSRAHTYRPANGGLKEFACTFTDPIGPPSHSRPLTEIWNACIDDLRGLSKHSDTLSRGQLSADAWEAMPEELRSDIDHPLASTIHRMVADRSRDGKECLLTTGMLATILNFEQRPKLTIAQSRQLASTVEFTGYALEPDARMTNRSYEWDDLVAVFLRMDDSATDSNRYRGAACMLELGLSVAEADGKIDDEELRRLTQSIDSAFQLPEHEGRRLEALKALRAKTGVDIAPIGKKIETLLPLIGRQAVGRTLVAIAAADNVVNRSEQTALRKCFRALGLGADFLETTISEILPGIDTCMVTVRRSEGPASPGEPIPEPKPVGLQLNRAAISAIMAETHEVAKMLAAAMEADSQGDTATSTAVIDAPSSSTSMVPNPNMEPAVIGVRQPAPTAVREPPGRYAALFHELVARDRWPNAEATDLARRHGVMLSGAVESINEWAFDALGGPLLDHTEESVIVDRSLL